MVSQTVLRSEKSPRGAKLCARKREDGNDYGDDEGPGLEVNGGMLEEVEQFCYLRDVLDCEGGAERAVRARVTAAWRRW